jgi:hypothetical protein
MLKLSCAQPAPAWLGDCSRLGELHLSFQQDRLPRQVLALCALRILRLNACGAVSALPAELHEHLRALEHLELCDFPRLAAMPPLGALTNLETLIVSNCRQLARLPPCMGGLRALHTCLLRRLPELCHLPENFSQLCALRHLTVSDCMLDRAAVTGLARALEHFPLTTLSIVRMYAGRRGEYELLLGKALRRRPPPSYPPVRYQLQLCAQWVELDLPPEARTWSDEIIVRHWRHLFEERRSRRALVLAFAGGLHPRLGAQSRVMTLNDGVLETIARSVIPHDPDARGGGVCCGA